MKVATVSASAAISLRIVSPGYQIPYWAKLSAGVARRDDDRLISLLRGCVSLSP
jgi:hypothetical protein